MRPRDEFGAVEEQNAHKAEQHNAGQHREKPVPLQNKAACGAGQQGGEGQADKDGGDKMLWPHACVGGGVGDDAVWQTRCDERKDRVKPRVFAAAHAVQQLGGLGIVGGQAADDRSQPPRGEKDGEVGNGRGGKARHKAEPRPIGKARRQLHRHGGNDEGKHLHNGQKPQRQKAAQPPLTRQIVAERLLVPGRKRAPQAGQQQAEGLHNEQHRHQHDHRHRERSKALFPCIGMFGHG